MLVHYRVTHSFTFMSPSDSYMYLTYLIGGSVYSLLKIFCVMKWHDTSPTFFLYFSLDGDNMQLCFLCNETNSAVFNLLKIPLEGQTFNLVLETFQDKLYPHWNVWLRKIWKTGWTRIYMFWIVLIVATAIVATGIITDFVRWDTLNRDFVSTNELSRAFLASFILVMDLLIVMQVCLW